MFPASVACPDCGAAVGVQHAHWCAQRERHEPPYGPLLEWLAGLPREYERLKAREAARAAARYCPEEVE
jgi:hypothetical protein